MELAELALLSTFPLPLFGRSADCPRIPLVDGLLPDWVEGVTGIGFAAEVPIRYPSRDADGERYADSESEAESHASSDAKVHSDALCAIFDFFELCGVRDRVAIVEIGRAHV